MSFGLRYTDFPSSMGHCCSCVCKNKKAFIRQRSDDEWVYIDFDSNFTDFDDDEETICRDEELEEILSAFEDALFLAEAAKFVP